MNTSKLTLHISTEFLDEWQEWVDSVTPTTQNPIAGERILQAARSALEKQVRRRAYQREHRRLTRARSKG